MGILDDTAIFAAIVQYGSFSHAAKHLELSNGLVSRRIAKLEKKLGVTLIKRTTRQLRLTPEGELFSQHAQRIQQELDSATSLIQSLAKKPKGNIRILAPLYYGRHYLTPLITQFLQNFNDIKINLILSNQELDPIKEKLDLVIRGTGYADPVSLKNSSMQMKILFKEKIGLYASRKYLIQHGLPQSIDDLNDAAIIYMDTNHFPNPAKWSYLYKNKKENITLNPKFICNDTGTSLTACIEGYGIGKFTQLSVRDALLQKQLQPVLTQYDWGDFHIYAFYSRQHVLPRRTRLLLEFINAHMQSLLEKITI